MTPCESAITVRVKKVRYQSSSHTSWVETSAEIYHERNAYTADNDEAMNMIQVPTWPEPHKVSYLQESKTEDQHNTNLLLCFQTNVVKLSERKDEHPDIKSNIDPGVRQG